MTKTKKAQSHLCHVTKVSTRNKRIDEVTGRLPQGVPQVFCAQAGSGKTLLAMEFLSGRNGDTTSRRVHVVEETEDIDQELQTVVSTCPALM